MNPQETLTSDLVEIVKQQAEKSFQKPKQDDAVWNELKVRYSWIGCPKEDLALIGSLNAVLMPLNNGRSMLPPRIRPGADIPPPPPYYQNKVSLSQVINKSSTQTAKESSPKRPEAIPAKAGDENKTASQSPWPSGSFYLFVFVVAFGCLTALARILEIHSVWIWPPITIGSFLATIMIGALQLRHDGKIQDKRFLILMKMVFKKMTLLEKLHW